MNLYLIWQSKNNGYDTYNAAVVAAESATDARFTHPSGQSAPWDAWSWVDPEDVQVEHIGVVVGGTEAGVICSSFNTG